MKKLVYLLIVILLFAACARNSKELASPMDVSEENESVMIADDKEVTFDFSQLATQKFQEVIDLVQLEQKHPEFRMEVKSQLEKFSEEDSLTPSNFTEITNIQTKGKMEQISDSIIQIPIYFDILAKTNTITDSLIAIVKTKNVLIDGQPTVATKVTFRKFSSN